MLYQRFFAEVGRHLNPHGRIYFLTGFLRNYPRMEDLISRNNLQIMRLNMDFAPQQDLEPIVYMIQHQPVVEKKAEGNKKPATNP